MNKHITAQCLLYLFPITLLATQMEQFLPEVFQDEVIRNIPENVSHLPIMVVENRPLQGRVAYVCAGVWIDAEHVLTAAHAVHGKDFAELQVVTSENKTLHVVDIMIHEGYTPDSFDADLALLKIEKSPDIAKPPLSAAKIKNEACSKDIAAEAFALGWTRREGAPAMVVFPVKTMSPAVFESIATYIPAGLDLNVFIAAEPAEPGSSFGAGNSGAPLFVHNKEGQPVLTGITSFMVQDPIRPAGQKLFFRKLPQDFSRFKKIVRPAELSPSPYAIHPVETGQSINDSFKPQNRIKGSLPVYVRHFRIRPETAGGLTVEIKLPDGAPEIQQLDPFISVHRMDTNQLITDGGQSGCLRFEVEAGAHYRISVEVQLKHAPDENGVPFLLRIR